MGIEAVWWAGSGVAGALLIALYYFSFRAVADVRKSNLSLTRKRWLGGFTVFVALVATAYYVSFNIYIRRALDKNYPFPEEELGDVTLSEIATLIPFYISTVLAGGFMIWRCNHIWSENRWIRFPSILPYVVAVLSGIASIVGAIGTSHPEDWYIFIQWICLMISIYTLLVSYLIFTIATLVKVIRFRKTAPPETRKKLSNIPMFTESFLVPTVVFFLVGVLYFAVYYAIAILIPAFVMLQFINTSIIISRIAAGTSFSPATFTTTSILPFNGSGITLTEQNAVAPRDASSINKPHSSFEV